MRSTRSTIAAVGACVALAGCSGPVEGSPVVRVVDAAKPSVSLPAEQALPTLDELAVTLGMGGFFGQLVKGGADMLLQGVRESEATPIECVSATYRLQKVVYQTSPVRAVASQSWAGGDPSGPSISGFFGVVKFATPDDAQAFFAASAEKWRRCNGQTMVLHQPAHGADGLSKIMDVVIGPRTVSAVVMHPEGQTVQRALGVAADCIVDVEITNVSGGAVGAHDAVGVANLMQQKIGVS
jgi:PknH-like extracellular domain